MSKPQPHPSGWKMQQAMTTLMAARQNLMNEDPELAADILGSDPETCTAMDVLDSFLRAAVEAEMMEKALKERVKDMGERVARYAARKAYCRATAFAALDALELPGRTLPELTASIRKGGQSVVITDEAALPDIYVEVTRTPKKAEISAALKADNEVPGAMLSNGLPSLTIKTK